jgi:mono/diheme cytochrome c family protein
MIRTTLPVACFGAVLLLAVTRGQGDAASLPSAPLTAASFLASRDTTPLYTAEQAARGDTVFKKVCVECHEPADYNGNKFREKWNGKPMLDLYEYIRTKMPDDRPGELTRDEYADALAYILKENGVPAGPNKIAPDSAAMAAVNLDLPPRTHP